MPKVIEDYSTKYIQTNKKKKINKCLMLSGGGTNQTFFSCGSVKCIVDNGLFDFELISAISGGTLLLTLIELCMSDTFGYYKKSDWYNRFVRKNLYKITDGMIIPTAIRNIANIANITNYVFDTVIPDFNKLYDKSNKNVIYEYNYVDANKLQISCDHTDIIDIPNNIKDPQWFYKRPLRCGLPFTIFNDKPTYDGGNICNISITTVFSRYKLKNLFIIHATPTLIYDTYPSQSLFNIYNNKLSNIMDTAENSIQDMLPLCTENCDNVIYCSMSNSLNKSKDKYHNGLFDNWRKDCPYYIRMYNGLIFNNKSLIKIIENEGYIQMYYQLKQKYPNKKIIFDIPNPDVYNSNVKQLLTDSINQNMFMMFSNEILNAPKI